MMDTNTIIDIIRSSFCKLTKFKDRRNTLEVITAYSTINNRFVSVFITITKGKIVLTDNGWIDQNYYENPLFEESEGIINRIIETYKTSYSVKSTLNSSGVEYYYKTCEDINNIPSIIFDLSNFIVGVVNAFCIQYKDEKEEKDRELFNKEANDYLKSVYSEKIKLRTALDDFKSIRFNAIINKNSSLYLLTYATGSTQGYFENNLRKSIVNFEIADKSKYRDLIKEKITIINDLSDGYSPNKSKSIIELLKEKSTREPIIWTQKERIREII